jgi:CRISPR/Cas system CSM-associated protein Csm3 (group 7 of RAMP superfamily)
MMFADRLQIRGELELLADLHLGSGRSEERRSLAGGEEGGEILCVVRDRTGRAVIPATSLKGALRAAAPSAGLEPAAIADLLGPARIAAADSAKLARFWLEPAVRLGPDTSERFAGLTTTDGRRSDGFVRTRLRLARDSAAAETGFLYAEETVAAGTRFSFSAELHLGKPELDPSHPDVRALARLLRPLLSEEGLPLGAGARFAEGRVRLAATKLGAELQRLDPGTGMLVEEARPDIVEALCAAAAPARAGAARRWHLTFRCEGPFLSIRENRSAPPPGEPQIVPLERAGEPALWPSSLLGALRARAGWLVRRERLRGKAPDPWFADREGEPTTRVDDRSFVCPGPMAVAKLSALERLFGVAGWRGELALEGLRFCGETNARHVAQSVSIDRLTGGAREGALFAEETFLFPVFAAVLSWRPRGEGLVPGARRDADAALLKLLLGDLQKEILFLGHGAAKGFGWFRVEVSEEGSADADRP